MSKEIEHDLRLIEVTAQEALDDVTETTPALEAIRDRVQKIQSKLEEEDE